MIERLHEATCEHHADAEIDFDVLFEAETTATHYRMFLARAYGFEAPLESMLAITPNLELMIDLKERLKAGFLAQDLIAMGLVPSSIAELPQCVLVPRFGGAAEALGWMYVVERKTLAHSVMRRHMLTRLPREMRGASSYLSCYTGVVGMRWRKFGATLDDVAHSPGIANRILDAANEAFRVQRGWIQQDTQDTRAAI